MMMFMKPRIVIDEDYIRLILLVANRHQRLFPMHSVSADSLAVWCGTCKKGIDTRTDGPHPDEAVAEKSELQK